MLWQGSTWATLAQEVRPVVCRLEGGWLCRNVLEQDTQTPIGELVGAHGNQLPLVCVCEWVNHQIKSTNCTALWIKALYTCTALWIEALYTCTALWIKALYKCQTFSIYLAPLCSKITSHRCNNPYPVKHRKYVPGEEKTFTVFELL